MKSVPPITAKGTLKDPMLSIPGSPELHDGGEEHAEKSRQAVDVGHDGGLFQKDAVACGPITNAHTRTDSMTSLII